jgi:hypothetical protein
VLSVTSVVISIPRLYVSAFIFSSWRLGVVAFIYFEFAENATTPRSHGKKI